MERAFFHINSRIPCPSCRTSVEDYTSTAPEDLENAPPALQELGACAASLSLSGFQRDENGEEDVEVLLGHLMRLTQPVEGGQWHAKEEREEEEEQEQEEQEGVERR